MKKCITRQDKVNSLLARANNARYNLEKEKEEKEKELETYIKRHRSLNFDVLKTDNVEKLKKIYKFFDSKYPVDWEGGFRCDSRGMKLCFWVDEDPDFLIIHLTSTSPNICFSGSTSWIAKAPTLSDKVELLKTIKQKVLKIIKQGGIK
ncbi:hypothetical protein J6S46_02945 [Candidatus Saccharibacteria bacterium]|nr:hypothetical protein [Candidatus Saccharibacteria bacterium]